MRGIIRLLTYCFVLVFGCLTTAYAVPTCTRTYVTCKTGYRPSNGSCVACSTSKACSSWSSEYNQGTYNECTQNQSSQCYKSCTKTCSGNATSSCPANATCSYNTNSYTTGTQYYGGSCSAAASSCPVSSFTCNTGYSKNSAGTACDPNKYTITYKAGQGGSGSDQTQSVLYGSIFKFKSANTFTKPNATFIDWYLQETGQSFAADREIQFAGITYNITMVARWSCNAGYYLNTSTGACDGVGSGNYSPNGDNSRYSCTSHGSAYTNSDGGRASPYDCYQSCTKTCSGNATSSCPAHATCSYNTSYTTSGTQYYGGSCSAASSSCPVSSWSCNANYYKDGSSCTACN
ncbi:MAG: InlB B-repeat-containing protein, partial [Alphaproteobacteria bacterium]|nr:InlB B-repeat-containing protein [Alphaproteobacteria bacterium]